MKLNSDERFNSGCRPRITSGSVPDLSRAQPISIGTKMLASPRRTRSATVPFALSAARRRSSTRLHRRAVHRGDDVARTDAGARRGAARPARPRGPARRRRAAFCSSAVSGRTARPSLPLRSRRTAAALRASARLLSSSDRDGERLLLAVAPHLERRPWCRAWCCATSGGSSVELLDRLAVEREDHVAGLEARLLRRAARLDLRRPARRAAARGRTNPRAARSRPGCRRRCGRARPCRCLTSWSLTFVATSIGIANETPM